MPVCLLLAQINLLRGLCSRRMTRAATGAGLLGLCLTACCLGFAAGARKVRAEVKVLAEEEPNRTPRAHSGWVALRAAFLRSDAQSVLERSLSTERPAMCAAPRT